MIEVDKVYTNNPFVDELIYYSKTLALNCVIKDEEEALNNESVESLKAGQVYISCVEGKARYDMFENFPEEILEKYIPVKSNLDLMVDDPGFLAAYLNSMSMVDKTTLVGNLDRLARTIYIDHYDVMMQYVKNTDDNWLDINKDLYNSCVAGTATYNDLFNIIPLYTRKRVIKQYVINIDNTDLNTISEDINLFKAYLDEREGEEAELLNIEEAFRSIFQSHYDIMVQRGYLAKDYNNNWYEYLQFEGDYNACLNRTATYSSLYNLFPKDDLQECLVTCLTNVPDDYISYICESLDNLNTYLRSYSDQNLLRSDVKRLNNKMIDMYLANYNTTLNFDLYNKAKDDLVGYEKLYKYMPKETVKIILNNFIDEVTNISIYSKNLTLLNMYLDSLNEDKAQEIKDLITKDMQSYYVENYVEKNNYYRVYLGLPPLDSNGNEYQDTLFSSYDERTNSTIDFGKTLLEMIPEGIYPDAHWYGHSLHEFDTYDISILESYGVINKFIELTGRNLNDKRYKYLNYLGDNALDIYTCRKALNFELMHLVYIDNNEVRNSFIEKYGVNRDYVIRTVYTEAHKFQSDYYNKFMIIFILINTIMDVLADVPKLIIDREIFDSRSIKYLFETFGIPYYAEIPVKYQQAMLKNLNILIKYKSSTKNMIDICSLFGFEDIKIFGYYMLKDRSIDLSTGNYEFKEESTISYNIDNLYVIYPDGKYKDSKTGLSFSKLSEFYDYDENRYTHVIHVRNEDGEIEEQRIVNSNINCYVRTGLESFVPLNESDYYKKVKKDIEPCNVKFVKVPIGEQMTDYKNDQDYLVNYDDITLSDDTWDGGKIHEDIKQQIIDHEFNAVRSKYISVETVSKLAEMSFQVSYFYSMLFDNLYSEENLTVEIPFIQSNHKFKFVDIVCYLFSLMYIYYGINDKIMYSPSQILYIKGYNFNKDYDKLMNDPNFFTQPSNPMDKENIFSINEMIAKSAYSYQEAFSEYRIKSFNLDADMDALNTWLGRFQYTTCESDSNMIETAQRYYDSVGTLSLDKFVVLNKDDPNNTFGREITLWDFYSLNNSHYQKDLFKNNLKPIEYNQIIRYGFDCELFPKSINYDLNNIKHEYIVESEELGLIINDSNEVVFAVNNSRYALKNKGKEIIVLYNAINKVTNTLIDHTYYYRYDYELNGEKYFGYYELYNNLDDNGEPTNNVDGLVYIKNLSGDYVYASNRYYTKTKGDYKENDTYKEITDDKYFITEDLVDAYGNEFTRTLLNTGNYFQEEKDENGNYVLFPDNDYVKVYQGDTLLYVLYKDIDQYQNIMIPEESMFIREDDGSFTHLLDSDMFEPTGDPEDDYAFMEENCFIISEEETEYFDPNIPDVFYIRLSDYYAKTDYKIDDSVHYVKDANGNYIPINELIDPNNCYVMINGNYYLVSTIYTQFKEYSNPKNVSNLYILNDDNFYDKYKYSLINGVSKVETDTIYVNESSNQYVLAVYANKNYDFTKKMIVVLNKEISIKSNEDIELLEKGIYDPEKTDGIWDENDWFYEDPSFDSDSNIGMNGENKWYYKKPGSITTPKDEHKVNYTPVGSGFYLEAESYLGSVELEKGEKYFISMDVECNFNGKVKIACDADSDNKELASRMYNTKTGEMFHVSQTFIANEVSKPRLIFFIYNYDVCPIHRGDYFIIKNIIVTKSHNANYIPKDIPSYDKLQEMYKINELCYNYLCKCMNHCSDYETYQMYQTIYETLMTSEYNKEMFKLKDGTYAETYTDFLQQRDSVLYEKLIYFKSLDDEARRKAIADNIIEVTYAIDDCVDTYSYAYLYSYFPAVSASYIQQYICKIIDFFKSWKVHLLGINTIYKYDDALENTVKILYDNEQKNTIGLQDTVFINDSVKINPVDDLDPDNTAYIDKYVSDDIDNDNSNNLFGITHRKYDNVDINSALTTICINEDSLRYRNNEVDLILKDDDISVYTDRNGNLIIERSDGFCIELPNNLLYDNTTDININICFNLNSVILKNKFKLDDTYVLSMSNDELKEYIESHKNDIAEQALIDARSINSINEETIRSISKEE